ncbi:MAG: hypothetical protein ACRCV6_04845 [Formosimonas sp.]
MAYTATIYVAAPGTPLKDGGTSLPGHVYYSISDGTNEYSYGFAPIKHGSIYGQGHIVKDDVEQYKDPIYSRTMEISSEQYNKLNEFGQNPSKYGFDMTYAGTWNNCVDFTWKGLNHAGLHYRTLGLIERKEYEGSLKPTHNVHDIKEISAPYPNSPLNGEHSNPWPKRTGIQLLLSEANNLPSEGNNNYTSNVEPNSTKIHNSLASNANRQEVTDFAFAALLSDDPVTMYKGLDQVAQTDVAQENNKLAQQAVIAYDNQQTQQFESPARVMTR